METKIAQLVQERYGVAIDVSLTRPDTQFGDYATNVAMQLAKPLGRPPRDIAEEIAGVLHGTDGFSEVTVAGPGFINIRLDDSALVGQLEAPVASGRDKQKIVIETNNPNPFKAMHIGHAFNAILADTVANLLERDGADVHRVSYHGDVGTHVGKSMWSILRYIDGDVSKLQAIDPKDRNTFMARMYAEGAAAYKDDETAKAEITRLTQQSFAPDGIYKEAYDICKAWSFDELDQTLVRLGNTPIEKRYLESEADSLGVQTVHQHVGDVFIESNGALVFQGSQYGSFDNAFVASDGRGLYAARDLGLMQLKNDDYHPEKSYIVTAEEQRDYFKGVIKAAELCLPDLKDVTVNISTGTVKLTTGKMSSRTGDVVTIGWLFDMISQAITDRGGEATDDIVAGALRYQFLKVKIGSDVVFDINEAVSLHGNSGSYLQYAYARAQSILQKATQQPASMADITLEPSERPLIRKLTEYHDVVALAAQELLPHHICTYLYELAQEFNRFYEKNKVIGSDREAVRVALVKQYVTTLGDGLSVLGIHAPSKM